MRKLLLGITLILGTLNIHAQETDKQRKNDILADPFLLIAVPLANVSYERLINKDMGIGINAMITLSDEVDDFKQFSPYFRYYMGRKYASGFFFEGFVPVTLQNDAYYSYRYDDINNTYYYINDAKKNSTTVGVGFGVGGKWVIKNRLVIEASGGIARRFGNFDKYDIGHVTGKIMGGIGYRF